MFDILSVVHGRKKLKRGGWYSFNAVCCHHRGHKPDRRGRAGIKFENQYTWRYHCFNCNFTCNHIVGKAITAKTKQLLIWSGIDTEQIASWSLDSLRHRDLIDAILPSPVNFKVEFEPRSLPDTAELINPENPLHWPFVKYLASRGFKHNDYAFMVSPKDPGRNGSRIIIPYTYHNNIVGHTSRFCDNKTPKYLNDQGSGYVFGIDLQPPEWQWCLLMEGVFDALAVRGCAYLHSTINLDQARTISTLNRRVIVVPDRDESGLAVTERALELGYQISIPDWDPDIKDVNDAVLRYGRLATVLSIVESATSSRVKLKLKGQKIK